MGNEGDHVKLVTLTFFVRKSPAELKNAKQTAGGQASTPPAGRTSE